MRSCYQVRPVLHFTMTTWQVVGRGRGIQSDCLFPSDNSANIFLVLSPSCQLCFFLLLTLNSPSLSFTFIWISFMLNLFPCHKFLFFQFLLGYLFPLCTSLLFWLWKNLFLFNEFHLRVAREGMYGLIHSIISSVQSSAPLGCFAHLDIFND